MQYVVAAFAFLTMALLAIGLMMKSERQIIRERMNQHGLNDPAMSSVAAELNQPFRERIILPFLASISQFAARFSPSGSSHAIDEKLIMAGKPWGLGSKEYLGIRVLSVISFTIIGIVASRFTDGGTTGMLVFGFCIAIGMYAPGSIIDHVIAGRQLIIRHVLPEMLDLLTVSVEAGLGLDGAMHKVVEKMNNPLAEEMQRALQEMRVGKMRAEAMRDMADRVQVSELTSFVAALCQADQLGGSISRVLRVQSTAIRARRMQRAREAAAKLPVKLLFPMVIFIFPAIFVVILAPGAVTIMRSLGAI
jgi:tight adherence protein C